MSTTVETRVNLDNNTAPSISDQIHEVTQAVRLDKRYLTARRAMTEDNIRKVAELFQCKPSAVGGSKQFLNTRHPLVAPVYRCLRDADGLVKRFSFDYPERGVRLMRTDRVEELIRKFNDLKDELREAVNDMANSWDLIIEERRADLGPKGLFNLADYRINVRAAFGIDLSFPTVLPDRRMERLAPEVYEAEKRRIAERMEAAVQAAEEEASEKLVEMLGFLVDKLQPDEDGNAKTLYSSALTNITEVCEWFQSATLRTNEDLDNLVREIEDLSTSVTTKDLKRSKAGRERFAAKVEEFKQRVEGVVVARPSRRIRLRD